MAGNGRPQWLNNERCFLLWMELGILPKVQRRLESEGIINPTTKEAPSEAGVRIAAWKWALFHPEEARKMFVEKVGIYYDNDIEYWFDRLERAAISFLTTKAERYNSWKQFFEKYKDEMRLLLQ